MLFMAALIGAALAGAGWTLAAILAAALWAVLTGRISFQMSEQTRASLFKIVPGRRRTRSAS